MLKEEHHRYIYLFGLVLLGVGLPLSNFLMSLAQFILLGNWLLDGAYREKLNRFWKVKGAVLFTSIYVVHLLGLAYTTEFDYAFKDLRIKLPILILPFIIASSSPLTKKEVKLTLWFFIVAVLLGSLVSMMAKYGLYEVEITDYRDLSLFISHIRFSLVICVAIFVLLHLSFFDTRKLPLRLIQLLIAGWLAYFLFVLKAKTGIVALLGGSGVAIIYWAFQVKYKLIRYSLLGGMLAFLVVTVSWVYVNVRDFYDTGDVDLNNLEEFTEGGDRYGHDINHPRLENGNYVWIYIASTELEQSWNKRSDLDYNGEDRNGQPLHVTLIRFLTSKGLRKDAQGVAQLSDKEIEAIENGIANVRYMDPSPDDYLYYFIWQVHIYSIGYNPQGHSFAQRLAYWHAAWEIFKQQPVIGVGTGDVKKAFREYYERKDSPLDEKYRLRAHSQYLTFLLTFGAIGFLWFMLAFLYPLFSAGRYRNFYFVVFITLALLSMLNEDTLETQAGVTFIVFFYGLFGFGMHNE